MFIESLGHNNCWRCKHEVNSIMCTKESTKCAMGEHGYFVKVKKDWVEPRILEDPVEPAVSLETEDALSTQVGGSHYKKMAIQPTEYSQKNKLNWCEGNIVKYASRHGSKNGAEDVRKIIHYAELLLLLDYGEKYER